MSNITDRLEKLRTLSAKLCNSNNTWQEAFQARDWFIDSIKEVIAQGKSDKVTKEDIINKLEDFICVIEPDGDKNDDE